MKILVAVCKVVSILNSLDISDEGILRTYVLNSDGLISNMTVLGETVRIYTLDQFVKTFNTTPSGVNSSTDYIRYVAYTEVQTIKREVVKLEDQ